MDKFKGRFISKNMAMYVRRGASYENRASSYSKAGQLSLRIRYFLFKD